MSSLLLDASATASQLPAVYAETLNCGAGGVIAGTDPAVGVQFSRKYGAVNGQVELLAGVYKDVGNPVAPVGEVGGTLSVAGLRFGNINSIATTLNAGNKVCGTCVLTAGVAVVNATGVNNASITNRSLIFLTRLSANSSVAFGDLTLINQTGSSFTINSLKYATPADIETSDNSIVQWFMINPDFSSV